MKKLMTLAFAALMAVTLSAPAWAQAPAGANNQTKTAAKKDTKAEKKATKEANKAKKKAAKQPRKKGKR